MESQDIAIEKPVKGKGTRGGLSRRVRKVNLSLRRSNRKRVVLFLAAAFLIVIMVGLFGFLAVQDLALSGKIFPGITIEGHPVGGLSRSDACDEVRQHIVAPIDQPVILHLGEEEFTLDPKAIDLEVDVEKMVEVAYWTGQSQNIMARLYRRFLDKSVSANIPVMVSYNKEKLKQYVAGVAEKLNYSPRSSSVDISSGKPEITDAKWGLTVEQDATVKAVGEALPTPERRIPVVAASVRPEVTVDDIGYILVITLSQHTLYLYDKEYLDSSYLVCVGSEEYPTPTGKFHVTFKETDPTWLPTSDWAKEKKGVPQPPGPDNPLGEYWMDLGGGIGIHATPFENSLGESVSHGCIRMSEWGASQVYNTVKVGTPVYIIE